MDKLSKLLYGLDEERLDNVSFIEKIHKVLGKIDIFSAEITALEHLYDEKLMNKKVASDDTNQIKTRIIISEIIDDIKELKMIMNKDKTIERFDKDIIFEELKQKVYVVLNRYINLEDKHKDKLKKILSSEIKLVDPDITDAQLEIKLNKFIETGVYDVFITSKRHNSADKMNEYVKKRHEEILIIQKNLEGVHAMYALFSVLIDKQDDTINTIQKNIQTAKDDIVIGTQTLSDKKCVTKEKKCIMI